MHHWKALDLKIHFLALSARDLLCSLSYLVFSPRQWKTASNIGTWALDLKPQRIFLGTRRVWRARDMYLVSHWLNIIQFQSIDLPGEAKQAGHVIHNAAPLFFAIGPVSEFLSELLIRKKSSTSYLILPVGSSRRSETNRPCYT